MSVCACVCVCMSDCVLGNGHELSSLIFLYTNSQEHSVLLGGGFVLWQVNHICIHMSLPFSSGNVARVFRNSAAMSLSVTHTS